MTVAPETDRVAAAADLLRGRTWVALTGAGISTDSGIPDYRGPTSVRATPMQFSEFTGSAEARRRYWARSYQGWRRIGQAQPNDGHRALAELERPGGLAGIITQNVDRCTRRRAAGPSSTCTATSPLWSAWTAAPSRRGRRCSAGWPPSTPTCPRRSAWSTPSCGPTATQW